VSIDVLKLRVKLFATQRPLIFERELLFEGFQASYVCSLHHVDKNDYGILTECQVTGEN
jgi:hypothetical protein